MDFWPEFVAKSWGKEFVAGGLGGMAGIVSGYPLDTLRIRQQQRSSTASAFSILRTILNSQGLTGLYSGMAAPLASVAFQNAMVFQAYAVLSRAVDKPSSAEEPPSMRGVAVGGVGTGAVGSLLLTPVELVKIRLQVDGKRRERSQSGPLSVAKSIIRREGLRGMYRGLAVTLLRDAPAHGVYFLTYEYVRETLHPGCRRTGKESLDTMLISGGLAGVASWGCCYPLDVIKTRIQADRLGAYRGIVDCFRKSVERDGYAVLFRGLGTALSRAFVVNGAIFSAYEISLRFIFNTS